MRQRAARKVARKSPQQSRSRITVAAILDATTRILDREGPSSATTTRIAEVAGVSVGTLYQYFEDRDAILDALQDREFERTTELMTRVLGVSAPVVARDVARAVVEGLLAAYARAPGLHRVLTIEGLRAAPTTRMQAFDMRVIGLVRGFLRGAQLPLRRRNLDAAAFVVFQAVRASMLARLLEDPPGLDDRTLVDELSDLLVRYLVADA
jgi:AcrR family transcriptional regulator